MPSTRRHNKYRHPARLFSLAALLLLSTASTLRAQNTPLISGAVGFFNSTNTGANFFQTVLAPEVVAPLGNHLLAESRFNLTEFWGRKDGTFGPYQAMYFGSTQYLQLNYLANSHLTVTGGRFLTPFGTYNERLSPIWISKFNDGPLITSLGTRTSGSSNGGMVRGVVFSKPSVQVNYLAYFSAFSNTTQFQAARSAGDRIDVYFPKAGLEVGTSYNRFLQGSRENNLGAHVWWTPANSNFQLRSEYAHSEHAQGYWIETDYRLARWNGPETLLGRLELLFRMQQTFRNSTDPGDSLPQRDTKQPDFGIQYHLPHEVRFNTSYSRKLTGTGNANIWDMSLTYRFLFPAWRGSK